MQVKDAMQKFASKVAGESSKPKVIDETVLVSQPSPTRDKSLVSQLLKQYICERACCYNLQIVLHASVR